MRTKGKNNNVFFVGVAGTGMSALSQYQVMCGGIAAGSDRAIDYGAAKDIAEKLISLGIKIVPQDGKNITRDIDIVVASTAIEDSVSEIRKAKELGIPIIHRSDYLAEITGRSKAISVAGTSGKSTVVAMIFDMLHHAGISPSLLTGGNLVSLEEKGFLGNCFVGNSDWLVMEADESDGSIARYSSEIGILLNMERDHKELDELERYFSFFKSKSNMFILNGDRKNLVHLRKGSILYHMNEITDMILEPLSSSFRYRNIDCFLPVPGLPNIENALAAMTVCDCIGVKPEICSEALRQFKGVNRRFQLVGTRRNIRLIDDYAHNPAKVQGAIKTAQLGGGRILAIYQPHGFGPTRFVKKELIESFANSLNEEDILWITEIYYAGGTADKSISSKEIVDGILKRGRKAKFVPKRDDMIPEIVSLAWEGDTILIMGARDPSLNRFAKDILNSL